MGMSGPLVGRDDERRQVAALLGSARNGRGGALLLTGDPGIGKTSLLRVTTKQHAGDATDPPGRLRG